MPDHFPDFSLAFFFLVNWKWIFGTSVPISSNRRVKKKVSINMPSAVIDVYITWKSSKRKRSELSDFWRFSCKLTYGNKYQTHLTRIVYIVSCSQSFYGFVLKEVGRNTPLRLVYLPTLLSCFSHFLRALQQNEAQSWPLYLLITIAIG